MSFLGLDFKASFQSYSNSRRWEERCVAGLQPELSFALSFALRPRATLVMDQTLRFFWVKNQSKLAWSYQIGTETGSLNVVPALTVWIIPFRWWLQPGTPLFIAHRPAHFGLLSQVPVVQSQYNLEKLSSKSRKLLDSAQAWKFLQSLKAFWD